MKKRVEDKTYFNLTLGIILTGFLMLGLTAFLINNHFKAKAENVVRNFNSFKGPANTYFEGLEVNFDANKNVSCSGFFNYTCTIDNLKIKAKSKKLNEDILSIDKAIFKNINGKNISRNEYHLDINLKGIRPINKLKDIVSPKYLKNPEAKKEIAKVYNILFPLDMSIKFDIKLDRNKNGKGSISFGVNDNLLTFNGDSSFRTISKKDFYSVVIDQNGTTIPESLKGKVDDKMLAQFKMNQKYFTYIDTINLKFINKKIPELVYAMYAANAKEFKSAKKLNRFLLDIDSDKEFSFENFKKHFIKIIEKYKKDDPNNMGKISSEFFKGLFTGKYKELIATAKRKDNFTLEEYLVLTSMVVKDKEKLLEKHYDIKVEVK